MKSNTSIAAIALLLVCCTRVQEEPSATVSPAEEPAEELVSGGMDRLSAGVPGLGNVLLSEELTLRIENDEAELDNLAAQMGATSLERLFPYAGEFEPRTRKEGLHRWYKVGFDESIPVKAAGEGISSIEGVELFEPVLKASNATNDTYWSSMWGINNTSYSGFDVNVQKVWNSYTVGNPDVIVCVVDGGIQLDHTDLAWNCLESGHFNYVDNTSTLVPHNHGTHVAGTIAAVTNNGKGVAGVAGGNYAAGRRGISLLSHQVFVTQGDKTTSGGFEAAIKDAADKGALVSQNSWGYDFDEDNNGTISSEELKKYEYWHKNTPTAFKNAVDYFVKYAGCDNNGNQLPGSLMKGGIVIFSAGNENVQYGPPANYEKCVAVGAIQRNGTKASFSCYGDWVDICAPGVDVASTIPTNSYASYGGTSMACPHVSAVAALLISYFGGQGFTADRLREGLEGGARVIGPSTGSYPIGPLVDAFGSFQYFDTEAPEAISQFSTSVAGNTVKVSFKGNGSFGYLAVAAKTAAELDSVNPSNPGDGYITARYQEDDPSSPHEDIDLTLRKMEFSTPYYVTVFTYNGAMTYSAAAPSVKVTTGKNNPPVVTVGSSIGTFRQYQDIDLPVEIYEPDENEMTVTMTSNGRAVLKNVDGQYRFQINCQLSAAGTFNAKIVAKDEYGLTTTKNFTYTVIANEAPLLNIPFDPYQLTKAGESFKIDLLDFFVDPDGETPRFSMANTDTKILTAKLEDGHFLSITAVGQEGLGRVNISATDAMGAKVIETLSVLVRPIGEDFSTQPKGKVTDKVTLYTGLDEEYTTIVVTSSSGVEVFRWSGLSSAFDPIVVDLSYCAPGIYTVTCTSGGVTTVKKIVKV